MPARFRPTKSGSRRAKPAPASQWALMWFGAFFLCTVGSLMVADYRVRPMVEMSARAMAKRAATAALNDAVTTELADDVSFSKIVHIDSEKDGRMQAAHIDFSAVTSLQAAATERADTALRALSQTTLHLPWTQVVGGSLITTFAPNLPVRMIMMGDAHSSVEVVTKSEGVNQSVHMIYLDLTAEVSVVSPFVTAPTTITSRFPVAYVVFAGEVPKLFLGGTDSSTFVPNIRATAH